MVFPHPLEKYVVSSQHGNLLLKINQDLKPLRSASIHPGVIPIGSMYGIFTHIWLICMVNVGKYTSPMDPMGLYYQPKLHAQKSLEITIDLEKKLTPVTDASGRHSL